MTMLLRLINTFVSRKFRFNLVELTLVNRKGLVKGILKHHYWCLVAHSRKERSAGKACTLRFEGEVRPSNGDIDSNNPQSTMA